MPTYFYHGTRALPDGVDVQEADGVQKLAPNLFYLGRVGLAEVDGLRIAFCGGSGAEKGDGTLDALVAAGMDPHQMRADVFAYAPRES